MNHFNVAYRYKITREIPNYSISFFYFVKLKFSLSALIILIMIDYLSSQHLLLTEVNQEGGIG